MDGLSVKCRRLTAPWLLCTIETDGAEGRRAALKKKKKKSRVGYQVAAGVMDVFGAAAAALAIVVLLLMLSSLYSWCRQDLALTFSDLTDNITDAVIMKK